jgi:hypothetical protein
MSRSKPFLVLASLAILSLGSAHPQQPAPVPESPSALTGSATGFVYYAETRLPARFAEINIVPIPSEADGAPVKDQPIPPGVPQQRDRRVQRVFGTSGMDGSFRLDGVPAGDYLVAALKPGYITPGAAAAMDWSLSEDQLKSLIASLPQVHVAAGQTASVSLTLHRAAVIAGRMQFADGSPVIGAAFGCESIESALRLESALRPENRGKVASPRQEALQLLASSQSVRPNFLTDDEGRYRIFGLSPGKYLVSTAMALDHSSGRVVMNDGSNAHTVGREHMFPEVIAVYAPETFRRKDAKVFEIHGDEQIADADLTIDPSRLHSLRGKVLVAEDRHAPFTIIGLKEDGAKLATRLVEIEDDGTFQVNYLPSGSYTLQITSSDVPDPANSAAQPTEYKTVKLTAVVGDQDVVLDDVLLVPLKRSRRTLNSSSDAGAGYPTFRL